MGKVVGYGRVDNKSQITDSALWRAQVEDKIQRGTNIQEKTYVECSLEEFKKFDHTKKNGKASCVNEFIEHIDTVLPASTCESNAKGYSIKMDTGESIIILSDGTLKKYNKYNYLKSSVTGMMEDGHIRTQLTYPRHTSIFLERLMYIAHCIYNECLPSSLDGISCNVMDSSGNITNVFGAKFNISPDNLEFCTVSMNSKAYQTTNKLYELTKKEFGVGKLYKISAYDAVLHDAVFTRPIDDILWYIERTGIQEVKCQPKES